MFSRIKSSLKKHGGNEFVVKGQSKTPSIVGNQPSIRVSTVVSEPESTATIFAKRYLCQKKVFTEKGNEKMKCFLMLDSRSDAMHQKA